MLFRSGSDKVKTICEKDTASLLECQNKTISYGYIGNSFDNKTKICCFVNISMDNRHFRDLWKTVESDSAVVSERLCLAGIKHTDPLIFKNNFVLTL